MTLDSTSIKDRKSIPNVENNASSDQSADRDAETSATTKSRKTLNPTSKSTPVSSKDLPTSETSTATKAALQDKQKRRKHKNSKLGCPNCKQRRVKCSEDLPSCKNCIKHKVECGYLHYTKEEIEELKQAKLERQQMVDASRSGTKLESEEVEHQPESGFGSKDGSPLVKSNSPSAIRDNKQKRTANKTRISKPKDARTSAKATQRAASKRNQSRDTISTTNPASSTFQSNDKEQSQDTLTNKTQVNGSVVVQNFDDLLGNDSGTGNSIIYPVYRMHQNHSEEHHFNIDHTEFSGKKTDLLNLPTTPTSFVPGTALPGAVHRPTSFSVSRFANHVNYAKESEQLYVRENSDIMHGEMDLERVRYVYWNWLRSCVYQGALHPLRFYCLLNICANYLISNCFEDSNKQLGAGATNSPIERGKELAHMRQTCLVKTIHYYDQVIKRLRTMLASNNPNPDTTCTISYLLGLTSMYDPERSSYSTNCYREGLFGMLEHFNSLSGPRDPPLVVKVQLKLMTNIMMTGNLPAYGPVLLADARQMLIAYGDIIFSICERFANTVAQDDPRFSTCHFLQLKYHQLLQFMSETIDVYYPQINGNMGNMQAQQYILYQMLAKWVIIFPSQLLFPNASQGPVEKVMYLFYKFVKKALFAVFPHVKFFFLRNFDGPTLLDVYASDDYSVYEELLQPSNLKVDISYYNPHIEQLKYVAAFLIRGSTYMSKRFAILYPLLMRFIAMHDFQGSDINEWRKTVQNFAALREDFREKMQVSEMNLNSLTHGYIQRSNYPMVGSEIGHHNISNDLLVDFSTLLPSGLLAGDYDPALDRV
ncbi:hypothetical protein KGF57_005134 [Candida theae]|uniref:Zn(2)-C6 fungal-type domain-containing protein n=1 Tax=Candida theae TaxID=1198502 RepID=A0AAD5FWI2_9ASCO|nr:uncharacterized protein KGF57_005134 [Candida theae]KAI5948941.1 hypothetical protein KGF57_005134 [Candida theae]